MARALQMLLVEDSENDAILLLRELKRSGYDPIYERVFTADDLSSALENPEELSSAISSMASLYT